MFANGKIDEWDASSDDEFAAQLAAQNGGIYQGAALQEYESVGKKIAADRSGIAHRGMCRACGTPIELIIEWHEFIIIGANRDGMPPLIPNDWAFSPVNRTLCIASGCGCGDEKNRGLTLHVTPEEARQEVQGALARGDLSQQRMAQVMQQIAARRGQ
jgi:hypothetical protein